MQDQNQSWRDQRGKSEQQMKILRNQDQMISRPKTKEMELLNLFSFSEVKTKEKNAQAIKNASPQIAYFRVKRQVNNPNLSLNPNRIGMDLDQLAVELITQSLILYQSQIRHRWLEHAKLK